MGLTLSSTLLIRGKSLAQRCHAANDNAAGSDGAPLFRVALRLWAIHGHEAGLHARRRCEQAFFAGDRPGYRWWWSVADVIDRKLAAELPVRRSRALHPFTTARA